MNIRGAGALVGVILGVSVALGVIAAVGMVEGVLVAAGVFIGVLDGVSVGVLVGVLDGAPASTACCTATNASRIPAPLSRSTPGASISIALPIKNARSWACVKAGFTDLTSAAIAPACGAA